MREPTHKREWLLLRVLLLLPRVGARMCVCVCARPLILLMVCRVCEVCDVWAAI